jgi:DNA-directed RNA polymerase specialized sigma subunit
MSFPVDYLKRPGLQEAHSAEAPASYEEAVLHDASLEAIAIRALAAPGLQPADGSIGHDEHPADYAGTDGVRADNLAHVSARIDDQEPLAEHVQTQGVLGRAAVGHAPGGEEDPDAGVFRTDDGFPAQGVVVSPEPVSPAVAHDGGDRQEPPNIPGGPGGPGDREGEEPDGEDGDSDDELTAANRRLDEVLDDRWEEERGGDGHTDTAVSPTEPTTATLYLPGDTPVNELGRKVAPGAASAAADVGKIDNEDEAEIDDGEWGDETVDEGTAEGELSPDELKTQLERDTTLLARWREGDERAAEELITIYDKTFLMSGARRVAMRYGGAGSDYDDILQNGRLKFLERVQAWEPERGIPLVRFVRTTVVREMARTARQQRYPVRVPFKFMDKVAKAAAIDLAHDEVRIPRMTDQEMADELGVRLRESGRSAGTAGMDTIRRAAALTYGIGSSDELEEGAGVRGAVVDADSTDRAALLREALDAVASSAPSKAKNVAIARLFLGSEDRAPMTWREIAELLTSEGDPADVWSQERARGVVLSLRKEIARYIAEQQ